MSFMCPPARGVELSHYSSQGCTPGGGLNHPFRVKYDFRSTLLPLPWANGWNLVLITRWNKITVTGNQKGVQEHTSLNKKGFQVCRSEFEKNKRFAKIIKQSQVLIEKINWWKKFRPISFTTHGPA